MYIVYIYFILRWPPNTPAAILIHHRPYTTVKSSHLQNYIHEVWWLKSYFKSLFKLYLINNSLPFVLQTCFKLDLGLFENTCLLYTVLKFLFPLFKTIQNTVVH